jgi:hypothetical protein
MENIHATQRPYGTLAPRLDAVRSFHTRKVNERLENPCYVHAVRRRASHSRRATGINRWPLEEGWTKCLSRHGYPSLSASPVCGFVSEPGGDSPMDGRSGRSRDLISHPCGQQQQCHGRLRVARTNAGGFCIPRSLRPFGMFTGMLTYPPIYFL